MKTPKKLPFVIEISGLGAQACAEAIARSKAVVPATAGRLTPQQVQNWRDVLLVTIGPYATLMSEDQIEEVRQFVQRGADSC